MLEANGYENGLVQYFGTERDLLTALKQDFARVNHVKPAASRADSAEMYLVATGFRGGQETL